MSKFYLADMTAPASMQGPLTAHFSRLANAIRAYCVWRIGRCNICQIFENIVLFLKLLKKIAILKKSPLSIHLSLPFFLVSLLAPAFQLLGITGPLKRLYVKHHLGGRSALSSLVLVRFDAVGFFR
jgi:hypothetical protein